MTKGIKEFTGNSKYSQQDNQRNQSQIRGLFEQYEKLMRYLRNFSEHTLKGCWRVFNRWIKLVGQMPTEKNLPQFVVEMRMAGLNTTTCNISITAFNSFLTWLKEKNLCPQTFSNGKPFKLSKLPEEKKNLRVFDDSDIHKILTFKAKGRNDFHSMDELHQAKPNEGRQFSTSLCFKQTRRILH
jgi:site-specific recombinase XerC